MHSAHSIHRNIFASFFPQLGSIRNVRTLSETAATRDGIHLTRAFFVSLVQMAFMWCMLDEQISFFRLAHCTVVIFLYHCIFASLPRDVSIPPPAHHGPHISMRCANATGLAAAVWRLPGQADSRTNREQTFMRDIVRVNDVISQSNSHLVQVSLNETNRNGTRRHIYTDRRDNQWTGRNFCIYRIVCTALAYQWWKSRQSGIFMGRLVCVCVSTRATCSAVFFFSLLGSVMHSLIHFFGAYALALVNTHTHTQNRAKSE